MPAVACEALPNCRRKRRKGKEVGLVHIETEARGSRVKLNRLDKDGSLPEIPQEAGAVISEGQKVVGFSRLAHLQTQMGSELARVPVDEDADKSAAEESHHVVAENSPEAHVLQNKPQGRPKDTIKRLGKVKKDSPSEWPALTLSQRLKVLKSKERVTDRAPVYKPGLVRVEEARENGTKTPSQNLGAEFGVMIKQRDRTVVTGATAVVEGKSGASSRGNSSSNSVY
ncbi:unnamed protein product [Peronospora destructor]|uniref:Uncharacterized protein n=1 Tax=Peronospora destructor TaxID=86335 RepID=A0AAV0UKZ4_9STRA|nr:unnamed protein product [Peronospora destructor]